MATSRSEAVSGGKAQPSSASQPRPLDDLPTDEEVAVLLAAAVVALSGSVRAQGTPPPASTQTAWRFSGRWWAHPIVRRRERPWPSA